MTLRAAQLAGPEGFDNDDSSEGRASAEGHASADGYVSADSRIHHSCCSHNETVSVTSIDDDAILPRGSKVRCACFTSLHRIMHVRNMPRTANCTRQPGGSRRWHQKIAHQPRAARAHS